MYFVPFAVFFSHILTKTQGGAVNFLNEATFKPSIQRAPHFVLFYAPWCGHCKHLLTTWNELAEKCNENYAKSKVKIAKVNCVEDVPLCSEQNILAYPTMKLFTNDVIKRYNGRRSISEFEIFIENSLNEIVIVREHDGLVTLTTDNFNAHIKTGLHFVDFYAPWCVHCQRLEPIWKAIAKRYEMNPDITICKVDCTVESSKCQELKVTAFPMLKMYKDGEEVDDYKLSRQMDFLVSYIDNQLAAYGLTVGETNARPKEFAVEQDVEELAKDDVLDEEWGEKEDGDFGETTTGETLQDEMVFNGVLELSDETTDAVFLEPVFVMFYVPWCKNCQRLKPIWETLGAILHKEKGPVVARVDCSVSTNVCGKYQISSYPTLILFKDGKRYFYNNERTLKSLHIFATSHHDEL